MLLPRIIAIAFISCIFTTSVRADSLDEDMLRARLAYDKKDTIALSEEVQQLKAQSYLLAPYAEYWLLLLTLDDTDNQSIADFLTENSQYPFINRLRGEYLKKLAKAGQWDAFLAEYLSYQPNDAAVACYAAEANAETHVQNALTDAKPLWFQAREQPANCNDLFDRMQAAHVLTEHDIWQRFRMSLTAGRISLAKGIAKRSEHFDAKKLKWVDTAYRSPQTVLSKPYLTFRSGFDYEVKLYALTQLARQDSAQAFSAFSKIEKNLTPEDRDYFYGMLAYRAAQRHEHDAIAWFQKADTNQLTNEEMDWYARAALREQNWQVLLNVIAQMSPDNAAQARWRYWKARALNATNQDAQEASSLLANLSTERHYYGWLAQDELKAFVSATPAYYQASDEEVEAVAKIPGIQRAEALQRLNLVWEAKLEWALATQHLDDKALLAAAEYAMRHQWHDLAIVTADKTTQLHDFTLRYPLPYRDLMQPAADLQQIDEAWVYAITRQESRFMHYAKSGVGASGLMQLMPATAKWIASRAGIDNYRSDMIHELDTNIKLGTYYLRHTLDLMGDQEVLATAAYNAGPSRAKRWMADTPLEGAIYAETIPFTETRLYVQRVMANAHLYAQRLGLKAITLKARMGTIPGVDALNNDAAPDDKNSDTSDDE